MRLWLNKRELRASHAAFGGNNEPKILLDLGLTQLDDVNYIIN